MNGASTAALNDDVISVHEAGHLIVGVLVGRQPIKVSINQIDGVRGCFWMKGTECGWDDFSEILSLLAGPRAQVALLPLSVELKKRELFQKRIIQPTPSPWQLPEGVYDHTGWKYDVVPVYRYLAMPNAPADKHLPHGTKHGQVVDRAEEVLLKLFADNRVRQATMQISQSLLKARCIDTKEAEKIVNQEADLLKCFSEGGLAWK